MKQIIILSILTIVATLIANCNTEKRADEASWQAFCESRGYDVADTTYDVSVEYLDTWAGSAEEEAALTKAGVKLN